MKKVIAILVMFAAFASQAEYLLWQVSDTMLANDSYLKSKGITSSGGYKAALAYGNKNQDGTWARSGYLTYNGSQYFALGGNDQKLSDSVPVNLSQLGGTASSYSYYIEIFTYQDSKVGEGVAVSQMQSYTDLVNANYIGDIMSPSSLVPWTGGSYSAPEPTSALLLVLGAALLGLKRKVA